MFAKLCLAYESLRLFILIFFNTLQEVHGQILSTKCVS